MNDVFITGVGIVSHLGITLAEFCQSINNNRPKFRRISLFDVNNCPVQFGGQIEDINQFVLPNRKLQKLVTRKDLLGIAAAFQAMQHAGISVPVIAGGRSGIFVGMASTQVGDLSPNFIVGANCISADGTYFDSAKFGRDYLSEINPTFALKVLMNSCLAHISQTLNLQGANANFIEYEISGMRAFEAGYRAVSAGECDVALVGGVSAPFDPFQIADHWHLGRLNDESGHEKATELMPHRSKATILSEGAVFLLLESKDSIAQRGWQNVLAKVDYIGQDIANVDVFYEDAPGVAIEDEAEIYFRKSNPQFDGTDIRNIASITGDLGECRGLMPLAFELTNAQLGQTLGVTAKNRFNQRLNARLSPFAI